MKNLFLFVIVLFGGCCLTGCGERVQVPPAHVGKVLTKNGYAPDTIPPSKFRLPPCFAYCDSLVLLEASDQGFKEVLELFMPKDKLVLSIEIRGTLSIPIKNADIIYDRVTSDNQIISLSRVYDVYGQQAVRGVVRSELVKYSISQIMEQREAIGQSIHAELAAKMNNSNIPIIVTRFELADVQPPPVIINAQMAAKEREIAIQTTEANAKISLVQAERDLEIARKNRLVEKEKALAIAEQNHIAAKSITPQLLAYRKLEVAEKIYAELAKSNNVIIIPADSSGFSSFNEEVVLSKMLGKELKK